MCDRHAANPALGDAYGPIRRAYYGDGSPVLLTDELTEPLRRRKTTWIATQLMGDLFHGTVSFEDIAAIYGVMAGCPQHTFVILTKRPARALEWYEWTADNPRTVCRVSASCHLGRPAEQSPWGTEWPLTNLIVGVSVEDQLTADERVPLLFQIPAAQRVVSVEPLLAPIDIDRAMYGEGPRGGSCFGFTDGFGYEALIQWIICGAETGPCARPMDLEWARSLRDQCRAAGVPFFFKRDSEGSPLLDGVEHRDFPEVR
jgi:protein gp37